MMDKTCIYALSYFGKGKLFFDVDLQLNKLMFGLIGYFCSYSIVFLVMSDEPHSGHCLNLLACRAKSKDLLE